VLLQTCTKSHSSAFLQVIYTLGTTLSWNQVELDDYRRLKVLAQAIEVHTQALVLRVSLRVDAANVTHIKLWRIVRGNAISANGDNPYLRRDVTEGQIVRCRW
jgi:hypothetical protein